MFDQHGSDPDSRFAGMSPSSFGNAAGGASPFGEELSPEDLFNMFFGGGGPPGFAGMGGFGGPTGKFQSFVPDFQLTIVKCFLQLLGPAVGGQLEWEVGEVVCPNKGTKHRPTGTNFSLSFLSYLSFSSRSSHQSFLGCSRRHPSLIQHTPTRKLINSLHSVIRLLTKFRTMSARNTLQLIPFGNPYHPMHRSCHRRVVSSSAPSSGPLKRKSKNGLHRLTGISVGWGSSENKMKFRESRDFLVWEQIGRRFARYKTDQLKVVKSSSSTGSSRTDFGLGKNITHACTLDHYNLIASLD